MTSLTMDSCAHASKKLLTVHVVRNTADRNCWGVQGCLSLLPVLIVMWPQFTSAGMLKKLDLQPGRRSIGADVSYPLNTQSGCAKGAFCKTS